jgi:hypothetical protein
MSIADKAQAHALLIDGQDVASAATRTVWSAVWINEHLAIGSELTGSPRKEWYDAVSTPEDT